MGSSSEFELLSHPGVRLADHLMAVGERMVAILKEQGVDDMPLLRTADLIGKTHDIGKCTEEFQLYIRDQRRHDIFCSHSPLSALYGSWAVHNLVGDPFLTYAALAVIYCHHGNLTLSPFQTLKRIATKHLKVAEEVLGDQRQVADYTDEIGEVIARQVRGIKGRLDLLERELDRLKLPSFRSFVEDLESGKLRNVLADVTSKLVNEPDDAYDVSEEYVDRLLRIGLLYSALQFADRTSLASPSHGCRHELPAGLMDSYPHGSRCSEELLAIRKEVRSRAHAKLEELLKSGEPPRMLRITAPTGSGKTATALSVALRLREHVERTKGLRPRIIYCLPYINIIEQVHGVVAEALRSRGIQESEEVLLQHHHLYPARKAWGGGDADDRPVEDQLLLFDGWESEIVVTTFVQLFETLLRPSKDRALKLHKLFGSIIILDEFQAIPAELWRLVRTALRALSKRSWIVLMSATPPSMIAENAVELVTGYEELYRRLDRVRIVYRGAMGIEDAARFVVNELLRRDDIRAVAVIVNTIRSSLKMYVRIKELLPDSVPIIGPGVQRGAGKTYVCYLSTNLTPRDRRAKVMALRDLLGSLGENEKLVLVCTQVIEAGVDLDFDCVVRDMAPIDSIVQAAGRCNRNWLSGVNRTREVHVIELWMEEEKDDSPVPTYKKVYGTISVEHISRPLLEEKARADGLRESDLLDVIKHYHRRIEEIKKGTSTESEDLSKLIVKLDLEGLQNFSLIEELPKVSVFVEGSDEASKALGELERLMRSWEELKERRTRGEKVDLREVLELKAKLRIARVRLEEHVVETWFEEAIRGLDRSERRGSGGDGGHEDPLQALGLLHVKRDQISQYYDPDKSDKCYYNQETGLRVPGI